MSAYLVTNQTISKLANQIMSDEEQEAGDIDKLFQGTARELAERLYNLNVYSLLERYDLRADIRDGFFYDSTAKFDSEEQYYMSLRCFTYQSCEGEASEKPLYKALEKKEQKIAFRLANKRADAKGARWS